jgi:hypothetical protein
MRERARVVWNLFHISKSDWPTKGNTLEFEPFFNRDISKSCRTRLTPFFRLTRSLFFKFYAHAPLDRAATEQLQTQPQVLSTHPNFESDLDYLKVRIDSMPNSFQLSCFQQNNFSRLTLIITVERIPFHKKPKIKDRLQVIRTEHGLCFVWIQSDPSKSTDLITNVRQPNKSGTESTAESAFVGAYSQLSESCEALIYCPAKKTPFFFYLFSSALYGHSYSHQRFIL